MSEEEEEASKVPRNAFDDDDDDDEVENGAEQVQIPPTTASRYNNRDDDGDDDEARRILPVRPNWSSSGSIGDIDLKNEVVSGGRKVPPPRENEGGKGNKGSSEGGGGGTRAHVPVAGRRAGLRANKPVDDEEENGRMASIGASEENLGDEARPAVLNRSGWGLADDDATGGGVSSGKKLGRRKNESDQDNSQRGAGSGLKKANYTVLNDNPDDVTVVIPDLADAENEDSVAGVAAAPSNKMNRMLALRELDKELEAGSSLILNEAPHGIDLSLLTATLNHPDQLIEDDRHWDWSIVFNQVASDIQLDIEANEIAVGKSGPAVDKSAIKPQ